MNNGLKIRLADRVDVQAVLRLERETPEAPHWPEGTYVAIQLGEQEEFIQRCLFVAMLGNKLAGFAVGKVFDFNAELESIAVSVDSRRQGIATELCKTVMRWCREQGADGIDLEVRAGSKGAIQLYERLSFVTVGLRHEYYRDPLEDAVTMRCGLEPSGWLW
jgi:ribosomal-protein-alanine N-acetyltransferase